MLPHAKMWRDITLGSSVFFSLCACALLGRKGNFSFAFCLQFLIDMPHLYEIHAVSLVCIFELFFIKPLKQMQ